MGHDLGDLPQLFEDEMLDNVGSIAEIRADIDTTSLRIVLRICGLEGFDERREIHCTNAIRWELTEDTIYWFRVYDEHPALVPFQDEQGDLYFSSSPRDPDRVADALRAVSARLLGRYFDFDAATNSEAGALADLLRGGHGKVASGPVTLMESFQEALAADGARANILTTGPRKIFLEREHRWVPAPRQLSFLDLGSSWVIAESLSCGTP